MFAELEIAKSAVINALSAIDENPDLAIPACNANHLQMTVIDSSLMKLYKCMVVSA